VICKLFFRKSVEKIQVPLKSNKNNGYFTWRRFHTNDNVLDKSCRRNQTRILCPVTSGFRKSCHLWDNVERNGGARGATNDVTIWRIRVACWISKATCTRSSARAHAHKYNAFERNNDSRTPLNVTLYVHCLYCYCL
jgi:hypothetical protein